MLVRDVIGFPPAAFTPPGGYCTVACFGVPQGAGLDGDDSVQGAAGGGQSTRN